MHVTDEQIRIAISELLERRKPSATICPSEVARALSPDGWRSLMPQVRTVAVEMAHAGVLEILLANRPIALDQPLRGPIRLGLLFPATPPYPTTPDGRYFVVRGRLWRKTNPDLPASVRDALIKQLMDARRALRGHPAEAERITAREQVDSAKRALGERGPAWWTDGAPDFNRKLAKNTPYRDWYAQLPDE